MLVKPVGVVVTLSGCRVLLAPSIASREPHYNFLLCFWLLLYFCPFVGVACVGRLFSAVADLIVHLLSFPFKERMVWCGVPLSWGCWRRHKVRAWLLLCPASSQAEGECRRSRQFLW